MVTKIRECSCKHAYQDAKYGKGMRVWNEKQGQKGRGWRCTVCGKEEL